MICVLVPIRISARLLIGLIRPKDGFRIVGPGVRVFDDEKKSVIQLLDFWVVLGCRLLFTQPPGCRTIFRGTICWR